MTKCEKPNTRILQTGRNQIKILKIRKQAHKKKYEQ
jgi:hypothetical protein